MDGSLFFRGMTKFFDFIKNVCTGSFIVGVFTANENPENSNKSIFARIANTILNGLPKFIYLPETWPSWLSDLARGSWFISSVSSRLNTPIPAPLRGSGGVMLWVFFALPIWVLAMVVFATPVLPTMVLAGMLLLVLVFVLFSRHFIIDNLAVFLLLFIIVNMIAGILSLTPQTSVQIALLTSVFVMSTMIIVACCNTRESVDLFFLLFIAGATIAGLIGVYQHLVGYTATAAWVDRDLHPELHNRLISTFGNPNVYGTYLLLAIPLTGACIIYTKRFLFKLLALGITGLLLLNLLLTYSRGCYLALALAVGIFILIMEKRFIVLMIPLLLAVPFLIPDTMWMRILSIFNTEDTSTAFRLFIWQGSLRVIGDFWMVGIGQGIEAYSRVYPYYGLAAIYSPHSHNLFFQVFIELGIVGILTFLGLLACFFRAMVTFIRNVTELKLKVVAVAMIAAVIGFLFQGIFDYVFYNYRVLLTFYVFLGLGIAFTKVHGIQKSVVNNKAPALVTGYDESDGEFDEE